MFGGGGLVTLQEGLDKEVWNKEGVILSPLWWRGVVTLPLPMTCFGRKVGNCLILFEFPFDYFSTPCDTCLITFDFLILPFDFLLIPFDFI